MTILERIFKFFLPQALQDVPDKESWEYSEEPIYEKEHRETIAIMEDILARIDEIKALVDEMKDKEDG